METEVKVNHMQSLINKQKFSRIGILSYLFNQQYLQTQLIVMVDTQRSVYYQLALYAKE